MDLKDRRNCFNLVSLVQSAVCQSNRISFIHSAFQDTGYFTYNLEMRVTYNHRSPDGAPFTNLKPTNNWENHREASGAKGEANKITWMQATVPEVRDEMTS